MRVNRKECPRPDWNRKPYLNLNGTWMFSFDPEEKGYEEGWYATEWKPEQTIQVPFCWESSLSQVEEPDYKGQAWYQKRVEIDADWKEKRIFLKFGAVDWKCKLWINGEEVGEHIGGYSAFEFDVTNFLNIGKENVLTLWVEDKANFGDDSYPALVGKQGRNAPCGYTHTSGIWQSVVLEARDRAYLDCARFQANIDQSTIWCELEMVSKWAEKLTVEYDFIGKRYDTVQEKDVPNGSIIKGSQTFSISEGRNIAVLEKIPVNHAKLWNYNDPNLYYGCLTVRDESGAVLDQVDTYFGMRKAEAKYFDESLGVKYFYINHVPVYMSGLLDQGFWEDGIYTAPSEEALKQDILKMKQLGFNMIRKHLKIEDPLQYYWCDKLGMFVWQDMPHATDMIPNAEGEEAKGRQYYEECLIDTLKRDYNHPSIVALMLFNETWGMESAYNNGKREVKAADGMSTAEWVEHLYYLVREKNPNILIEDMSPVNKDHVQPTDLNTYHMYVYGYQDALGRVEEMVNQAYVGSQFNFKFGHAQNGNILMNSEYGGVGAYEGDYDVSYCMKYMTDIQRRYVKQSGFVYTEPYDIEYERNGILTYDRKQKIFGYDEIAWGGDMGIRDLMQEIYVGVEDDPCRYVKPGETVEVKIVAVGWTEKLPQTIRLKWRLDGTDVYGNPICTGYFGEEQIEMRPYRQKEIVISYRMPEQTMVGTLTVWLEDDRQRKLAKNFTNVIAFDEDSKNQTDTRFCEDGMIVMKAALDDEKVVSIEKEGKQTFEYLLPENFDVQQLKGMRILAEVSSCKEQLGEDKNLSSYSAQSGQTAEGRERASDVTISVNGVEIDTVFLPDNPRDMRGTLTLDQFFCKDVLDNPKKVSAGDFGYLVNLRIDRKQLDEILVTLSEKEKRLRVTYEVKPDAVHKNGFRIYSGTYGRYAVSPMVLLNPPDTEISEILKTPREIPMTEDNYSAEVLLRAGAAYQIRSEGDNGYRVTLSESGTEVLLQKHRTGEVLDRASLKEAKKHNVKAVLFDERIQIYIDNHPEPVISLYDRSGYKGGVTICAGVENTVITPQTYQIGT